MLSTEAEGLQNSSYPTQPHSIIANYLLYNNQINARALIGQSAMVYCASKPKEISRVSWPSELLCKNNRPQVSMVYRLINHLGCGRTLEEFVNHSSAARDSVTNSSRVLPTSQVV